MVRKSVVVLGCLIFMISCGGNKGATPENADNEGSSAQSPGPPADTAAAPEEAKTSEALPSGGDPQASSGDPSQAATTPVTEEESNPAAAGTESSSAPPSDDLQSYVGTNGAYTPEYRTVTDNMGTIKQCYLDAMRANPDLQGMLKVKFTVNKAGKVSKASAILNELDDQVEKCVIATLKKLKFPKRTDNRTVEYPFKFMPSP